MTMVNVDMIQSTRIYSIGQSALNVDDWLTCLIEKGITTLIDIRLQPEQAEPVDFTETALRSNLAQHGIIYHWVGRQLGNGRPVQNNSSHIALSDDMQAYADYMRDDFFILSVNQLVSMAAKEALAFFTEAEQPQDCYRGLIADYLTLQGHGVTHLFANEESREHQLHPAARRESVELIYDRP